MKSIIFLLSIILGTSAQAAQVLHCQGGMGGPARGEVILSVESTEDGLASVAMHLKNAAIPEGISGELKGQYYTSQNVLVAAGKIGDINAFINLTPLGDGTHRLAIAADSRKIELGYQAWFLCK